MLPIGYQITLGRLEKKLTQKQLADKAGVPQPNLSNIEKGKQDITVTTLRKIAVALEIPLSDFFDAGHSERKKIRLTRPAIEKLVKAIAGKKVSLNPEEKEIVRLFQEILPQKGKSRLSVKKMQRSWMELKKRFDSAVLNTIHERVREISGGMGETAPN